MTKCDVKGAIHSDETMENYHPAFSALASFSALFWCYSLQLYCFGSFSLLS